MAGLSAKIALSVLCFTQLVLGSYSSDDQFEEPAFWINDRGRMLSADLGLVAGDIYRLRNSLFHPSLKTYALVLASIGLAGAMSYNDHSVRYEVKKETRTTLDNIIQPWERYGGGHMPISIAASFYLSGLTTGNSWLQETGRELFVSIVIASVTTGSMKVLFGRERPYKNDGPFSFNPTSFSSAHRSFPSGHTTMAFAVSSVLAGRIDNPLASLALYGAAGMTGVQRVYNDKHWLSDVIMGAIIGTTSGLFALRGGECTKNKECRDAQKPAMKLAMVSVDSGAGIGFSYNF